MGRRKRRNAVVAAGAALSVVLPSTTGCAVNKAEAAPAPEWSYQVTRVELKPVQFNPGTGDVQTAEKPHCPKKPGTIHVWRTWVCTVGTMRVAVLHNGAPAGSISMWYTLIHRMNAKSRVSTESIKYDHIQVVGAGAGFKLRLQASCPAGCSSTLDFPQLQTVRPGATISGTGTYRYVDNKIRHLNNNYIITMLKPGYTPATLWDQSFDYRCDNSFGKRQGAGCVAPSVGPFLDMRPLKFVARGIRRIWSKSPGKYGKFGSGNPLHHISNKKKADDNRRAVCGGKKPPAKLPSDWPKGQKPSCDEYPIAHSREGGKALGAKNRGITWVPLQENNSQGGRLNKFILANRVLNGDLFWVLS